MPYGYGPNGVAIDYCRSCGRQMRNYARTRHVGDDRVVVSLHATTMDAALALIAAGVFSVGKDDAIWRHARFDRWGRRTPIEPPRRADHKSNGYWRLHFKAGGRQHEINVARLVWVYRHGPVPPGYRIGGGRGTHAHLTTRAQGRGARRDGGQVLVHQIHASVPTWLPDELRDEICQELAVAVLAGDATLEDIPAIVRTYRTRVNRTLWPYFERLSLDQPIRNGATLGTFV